MLALHSIPSRTKLNGNLLAQNILTTLKSQVMALPYNLRLAVLVMEGNENQYASSSYFKKKSEIAHQLGIKV
jgi:5,10-methylene-tetrahydrofolate dehydrogenase/methenyl tetrahydrofolate cyclohydrolase